MKELLSFLIKSITGSENFEVEEETEEGRVTYHVKADPNIVGLIIGKQGKTIKNIRKILSIRATLEQKAVNILVNSTTD